MKIAGENIIIGSGIAGISLGSIISKERKVK